MPQKIPYCSRPWTSLMLYPDRAGAECSLSYRLNCPTNGRKFDEIWNSEQLKNIRRSILEDRAEILGCGDCEHYGSGLKFYDELTILCNSTKAQRNLRFNREEFLAGNIYLASKPLSISADLCYKCNFRCIMCDLIHDAKEMDSGNLTTLFKVLTNTAVHLHVSGGEPLMHKGFVQYLTSPVAIPSVLSITTNGSLLNKNVLEELKKFPNVNLHISIDSFNLEVFSCMRPGSNPIEIMKNLDNAIQVKNDFKNTGNNKSWYICLQFLPCTLNIKELSSYIRRASYIGVDAIQVCELVGEYPQYDITQNPTLFENNYKEMLIREIRSAIAENPKLEISGVEKLLSKLENLSVKPGTI